MRYFKEATSKPYGYLLIDLKPTTPEHLRLRTDALDPIKSGSEENNTYSLENPPSDQTHQEDQSEIYHSNCKSHPEQLQIFDSEYTDSNCRLVMIAVLSLKICTIFKDMLKDGVPKIPH